MDNAKIHHDPRLIEICNGYGVAIEYLPPYSPDFNPIEATFKDLKAWIKLNYQLSSEFTDFGQFLHLAITQVCRNKDAVKGHFRTAGYHVITSTLS